MPLFYDDGSEDPPSVRLYATPSQDNEGDKTYLSSNSHVKNASGNYTYEDLRCVFEKHPSDPKRFKIVRPKDGWVASAHDHFVVFHPVDDNRDYWFVLKQVYDNNTLHYYLTLADTWVCIGDRYGDGTMYMNLKKQGYWALAKSVDSAEGILHDGAYLSEK